MLDSLTSGLIDESKAGKALFILHSCTELLIFDPVLERIGVIGAGKDDLAVTDSEREITLCFGDNPNSRFSNQFGELSLVVVVHERGHMGTMVMPISFIFMSHMLDIDWRLG